MHVLKSVKEDPMAQRTSSSTEQLEAPTVVDASHTLPAANALGRLDSCAEGLTREEARRRQEQYGPNALPEGEKRSILGMVADQFKDFLILLLLAAALISGALGEIADTVAILVILVLNAAIGVFQEYRAERAMEALREMAGTIASVRRDGQVVEIPAIELTLGDVVLLDAGRIVPADLRLIESAGLRAAEAALTGESLPVEKHVNAACELDAPLGDRVTMAYRGTQIVYGRGEGVVTAIGLDTELGKIAGLLGAGEPTKTPLQKRLAQFGKQLGLAAIGLCFIVFIVGLVQGEELVRMFMTSVSLAVAAVPEALPAIATITLAMGASRLVKQHTLVRRLPAVETLGSVTYICTDKTGTLTLNQMTVEHIAAGDALPRPLDSVADPSASVAWLGWALAVSNDVAGDDDALIGDPTEVAFYRAAQAAGCEPRDIRTGLPRAAELPFDSDRKLMTTVHKLPEGGYVSFTKGAAEAIVERAVDARMAPVKRLLLESARQGPGPTEIIGGIGYIVGLFGVAAFLSARRKDRSGK